MRGTYLAMIKAIPGGWDVMCAALGLSRDALENRVYERKGQSVSVDLARQMQVVSGTTLWAEAVAAQSGGAFVRLPDVGPIGNEELLAKFNALYGEVGRLSHLFQTSIEDDDIDPVERRNLEKAGQQINCKTLELLAVAFRVFCKPSATQG